MEARPEPPTPEQPKDINFNDTAAFDDPDHQISQYLLPPDAPGSITPTTDPPFPTLTLAPPMTDIPESTYNGPLYSAVSCYSPPSSVYPPALMSLSVGEMVSSGTSRSSGPGSYSSDLTSVPRSMRYNPISVAPSVVRSGRGRNGRPTKHGDPTDNGHDPSPMHDRAASNSLRRQEVRGLRIEFEQRKREELKASYRRLKDAVPMHGLGLKSHQKLSKIVLLDRATTSINSLEKNQQQLLAKIREVEEEGDRLRQANEALALSSVAGRSGPCPSPAVTNVSQEQSRAA
ncbi:hypothetical protein H4582DRAFT_2081297 [Lactarius indigo]|nr:hypothetical protein H4582DRAFT_2081297 [Lactarius indigo]